MSVHALLNLLNKLRKFMKCQVCRAYRIKFNKFNNTVTYLFLALMDSHIWDLYSIVLKGGTAKFWMGLHIFDRGGVPDSCFQNLRENPVQKLLTDDPSPGPILIKR